MLEDIARHCPLQLMAFHRCMAKPPLEADCQEEQKNLSLCIKASVPVFHKIQSSCSDRLKLYEACIRANGDRSKCQPELQSLRDCATATVKTPTA